MSYCMVNTEYNARLLAPVFIAGVKKGVGCSFNKNHFGAQNELDRQNIDIRLRKMRIAGLAKEINYIDEPVISPILNLLTRLDTSSSKILYSELVCPITKSLSRIETLPTVLSKNKIEYSIYKRAGIKSTLIGDVSLD